MDVIDTIEDEGTGVITRLYPDDTPESPRTWDHPTVMLCAHRGYELGDTDVEPQLPSDGGLEATCETCEGEGADESGERCHTCDGAGEVELDQPLHERLKRWVRANYELASEEIYPLGLIDHSGISMYLGGGASPSDPGGWDSGTVGVIFCPKDRWEACMGDTEATPERVREVCESSVDEYDQYLTGDVYGVMSEDADGAPVGDDCWGYFGHQYARERMRDHHEDAVQSASNEAGEAAYWAARDVLTV